MSPKIRTRRRSAAASFSRIDFIPSRIAAAAWLGWLVMAGALAAHTQLPWQLRLAIAALVMGSGGHTLWSYVLLRGPRSLRALEWSGSEPDTYYVWVGPAGRRLAALPEGCRRYGTALWLLRFRTAEGLFELLVETGRQDQRSLRRLGHRLFGSAE
ncbi:MAG TPA: hypothetical protein VM146_04410 [Steroidobacteraceae bacterium]|nr:hypothetical protein [Steroidobacteraceae bacterium]